jgi:hypothetical protein
MLFSPPFTVQRLAEVLMDEAKHASAQQLLETVDKVGKTLLHCTITRLTLRWKLVLVSSTIDNPTARHRDRLPVSAGRDGMAMVEEGEEHSSKTDQTWGVDESSNPFQGHENGHAGVAEVEAPLLGENQTLIDSQPVDEFVSTAVAVTQDALAQAEAEQEEETSNGAMDVGEDSNSSMSSTGSDNPTATPMDMDVAATGSLDGSLNQTADLPDTKAAKLM